MLSARQHGVILARKLWKYRLAELMASSFHEQTLDRAAGISKWSPRSGGRVLNPQRQPGIWPDLRQFSSIDGPGGPAGPNPRVVKDEDLHSAQEAASTSVNTPGSGGNASSSDSTGDAETSSSEKRHASSQSEGVFDDKTRTLQAALTHVPRLGWTEAALREGAKDVGLSPSFVGTFARNGAQLVEYFMDEAQRKLVEEAEGKQDELSKMILRERLAAVVRMRLEMLEPYLTKWPQALNIQLHPANAPKSLKQRALLIDEIWHLAGDRSTHADWYAKRAMLGWWYNLSEVYMLTDLSPEFRNTWDFVKKRMDNVVDCSKTAQETAYMAQAVAVGLGNAARSYMKQFVRSAS